MKPLKSILVLCYLIIFFNCSNKNNSNDEQQIREIIAQYDQATIDNNIDFFKEKLASDYAIATTNGEVSDKSKAIKEMEDEKEKPTYKMLDLKSDDLDVKVSGDMAVVTGKWYSSVASLVDENAEPHNDEGRYTCIFEKRDGQWVVIKEHITEKPHDKVLLKTQLEKASLNYDKALLDKDSKAYASLLAEDYVSIGDEANMSNKAQEVERIASQDLVFTNIETTEKNFRLYRNTAVETGKYNSQGMYKGKTFSEMGRYTATWVYRDGKWMIVSEQSSPMPKS